MAALAERLEATATVPDTATSLATSSSTATGDDRAIVPAVDIVEDANGVTLTMDMPGVPRDQLRLDVDADHLRIEGELRLGLPAALAARHTEVPLARYRRAFVLGKALDANSVQARLEDGVLTVRVSKLSPISSRRVSIQSA